MILAARLRGMFSAGLPLMRLLAFGAHFLARLLALGTFGLPVVGLISGSSGRQSRRRSAEEKGEE